MAAIITPTNLTLLDHSNLKHLSSSPGSKCSLPSVPTSIVSSAETNSVYISVSTGEVLHYDIPTASLQNAYPVNDQCTDRHVSLLCKDRGKTLLYGRGQHVVVSSTQTGKPSHTFDTHKAPITSLSLSNDTTLLASTSAHAIHVHNLTLVSHTVLRGVPLGSGSITVCAFHPHSRTRLLVGLGAQLLVYDTTRPSGPSKVVPLDRNQKGVGQIVSIACSPFSKTLVAVACSGGMVGLVDLEKERGLFRTVSMPAPLTCLSFSAEGAALYAGTENGKFLLLDLRALDKPPKSITVSDNGDPLIAIAVQKKLKSGEAQETKSAAYTAAKPLVQRDTNKVAPGVRRATATAGAEAAKSKTSTLTSMAATPRRAISGRSASTGQADVSPPGRVVSGTKRTNVGVAKSPIATQTKRAFSPPKVSVMVPDNEKQDADEGDLSVRIENLLALPKTKEPTCALGQQAPSSAAPSKDSPVISRAQISESTKVRTHTRTASASSNAESASAAAPLRMRSVSSSSVASRMSRLSARTSAASTAASGEQRRRVSGSSAVSRMSRTPSPDLPGMEDDAARVPVTPFPGYKVKGKERAAALGFGSPEVDGWVKAGEGRAGTAADNRGVRQAGSKHVGFAGESDSDAELELGEGNDRNDLFCDAEHEAMAAPKPVSNMHPRAEPLAMQVSPARRSLRGSATAGWAAVPSPLRNTMGGAGAPQSPQARAAQDMLQALLRDALHDFRQETKGEIVGLHLDLIRMGTSWRREMREAMGELGEEMRALREENVRLREENERLRRGY